MIKKGIKQNDWYVKNREKVLERVKQYREDNKEKILKYEKQYRENNKEKKRKYSKEWYDNNLDLNKEKAKNYRENNKEKLKEINKKYVEKNKDSVNKYKKDWAKRNPEKVTKAKTKYALKKIQDSPLHKLRSYINGGIRQSLKRGGYTKKSKTHEILGCSFEVFKLHLENHFEPWMNWDNYGNKNGISKNINTSWDIDHITPLSSAKTEEDILKLNHYTNLKPLCSYINRWVKKGTTQQSCPTDLILPH